MCNLIDTLDGCIGLFSCNTKMYDTWNKYVNASRICLKYYHDFDDSKIYMLDNINITSQILSILCIISMTIALSYIILAVIYKSMNVTFIITLNTLLIISKVIVLITFSTSIYMASIHKNAIDESYSYFSNNIRIVILISYSFIWYIVQGFDIYILIKNVKDL